MKRKQNEEYKESQITTIFIFGFKLGFARKHNSKKICVYHQILLQILCVAGYDTVMIYQIWIYINIQIII